MNYPNITGYERVRQLAYEYPDWIPIVEECLNLHNQIGGVSFAGAWVFDSVKRKGHPGFPNLKRLVRYGILEKTSTSRGGKRGYYKLIDSDGVVRALMEIKKS